MAQQTATTTGAGESAYTRRLAFFFGLAYFAQGIGQHGALIAQPLQFYFKSVLGLDPAQVTEFLAVVMIPWILKPLYGLVSDFIPLLGYRRKTWLLLVNAMAAAGFLWITGNLQPGSIVIALTLSALGTAASDVIIDATMVEAGNRTGLTAQFQSVQWLWISIASIVSALLGGYLCDLFEAGTAVRVAALLVVAAPIAVAVSGWLIVREEKSVFAVEEMKATTAGLLSAVKSRTIWAVIGFLAFWNFSPSFGTPWYYHQTDTLRFTQSFIGILGGVSGAGAVLGAFAYWRYVSKQSLRAQLELGIWTGTAATLLYLLLLSPSAFSQIIAIAVNFVAGVAGMIALLATLTLAARACPSKAEGFTFAALMSVNNGVVQLSAIVGARLYTDVFKSMWPLILISAAFTLACYVVLPLVRDLIARDPEPAASPR